MRFIDIPREKAAEQHALKRLYQRFGIAATTNEYRELSAMCAAGNVAATRKAWDDKVACRVSVRGISIWAIYDPGVAGIVTFLRSEPAESYNAVAT